ncbi:type IV secretion system protein VirB10 [Acinetobacter baumannii]|nr:type IV secretion system protein VirB10 [Acinetobacter baumannii]
MSINDEKNLSEISHDENSLNQNKKTETDFIEEDKGIVSVNERGDQDDGMGKKIAFLVVLLILFIVGGVFAYNYFTDSKEADEKEQAEKAAPDPELAKSGKHRDFANTDPSPVGGNATATAGNTNFTSMSDCQDQSVPKQAVDAEGKPFEKNGMHIFVCNDGQQILKQPTNAATTQAQQQPVTVMAPQGQQSQFSNMPQQPQYRYGGGIFVNSSSGFGGSGQGGSNLDDRTQQAYQQVSNLVRHAEAQNNVGRSTGGGLGGGSGFVANNSYEDDEDDSPVQAKRADTNMASLSASKTQARFIGDRNFLLAKGRVIKCNLSTKVVSEVGGMATCVIPQPIYSENGKVVLAEAGSEVTGEYKSITSQGQRRLNILWTRLKTPHGVVVDLDSNAADALGTAGVAGKVDNRWGARIGAAFMLSLVQDAIAYGISKETNGSNQPYVLQNTSETGKSMAETVLNSTINIKPTIYKNQGDVASIFVAKDIDFRGVYELRAK